MSWPIYKNLIYNMARRAVSSIRNFRIRGTLRAEDHRELPIFIVRSSSNFDADGESANAEKEVLYSYLESHLSFMRKFWLSIKIDANQDSLCGKIMFVILLITGVFQHLDNIRFVLFQYSGSTELEERIRLCRYINHFILHICFIYILTLKSGNILKVIHDFKDLNIQCLRLTKWIFKMSTIVWTNGILVITLVLLATLLSTFNLTVWTPRLLLDRRAYQMLNTFFIWTTETNSTQELVLDEYANNMSLPSTLTLGISKIILIFVGGLKTAFIKDVLFVVAINMYILCSSFYDRFKEQQFSAEKSKEIWNCYCKLKQITGDIDNAFGFLFKLAHLDNALHSADLLLDVIHGTEFNAVTILNFFILAKIGVVYYLCVKMSTKMLEFRYWIHSNFHNIKEEVDEGILWPISVILDDFEHNSVGIGLRDFYVNESFVAKFLGIVASTYVVFSST